MILFKSSLTTTQARFANSFQIFNFYKEHGIIVSKMPPHTSDRLQPSDLTFFGLFINSLNRETDLYAKMSVTPYELAELFNKVYMKVANMDKAESLFIGAGIFLNREKFSFEEMGSDEMFPTLSCFLTIEDASTRRETDLQKKN